MQALRGARLLSADKDGHPGPRRLVHRAGAASLKIVFVNRFFYPDISATSQLLTDLAFFLALRGHQVSVVTSRQLYQDPDAELPPRELVKDVDVIRVATTRFGRGSLPGRALDYASFYLGGGIALWMLARSGVTVVAKTDPPMISVVAALICRLRGARLVNWLQDIFPEIAIPAGASAAKRWPACVLAWVRDRSLARAVRNLVLGERMGAYVQKRLAKKSNSVVVIPNWTDGRVVVPVNHEQNPLREEWGLRDHFVVAYSGNMGRVHEFETILGAAERLKDRSEIRFVFIGDGRWRRWLEERTKADGLANIVFKPYQPKERLALSLGAADVHLISLRAEMEGLVVPSKFYGIAAAGRPTLFIGDPDGEIPRILARHDIGVTLRPGDVAGLVAALLELKADPQKRLAMGTQARKVFEAQYDRPIALAKWEALLRDTELWR